MNQATLVNRIRRTHRPASEPIQLLQQEAFITKALECLKYAKKSVLICAYDWRWYAEAPTLDIQKFNYELARRIKGGLDCRAILDKDTQAEYLRGYGIKAKTYPTEKSMHTKAILIDEKYLILGSHNLTQRGTRTNYEISVLIDKPDIALEFLDYFNQMWRNYAV